MTKFSKKPSFKNQPHMNPMEEVAGRLVVFPEEKEAYVSGTCFRLATNLYMTAAHVIRDFYDQFSSEKNVIGAEAWVVHILQNGQYSIWKIDTAWISPLSDIAVFHTRELNDIAVKTKNQPCVGLELEPPKVGERVVGFGFHSSIGRVNFSPDGTRNIEIDAYGAASVGEVIEIHHEKRDSSRLCFPCFHVNARFDGGMSGGPILSDRGKVCGIICSNLPPDSPEDEHVSYAATLWPAMSILMNVNLKGEIQDTFYPLYQLASSGVIKTVGLEKLQIIFSNDEKPSLKYNG